MPAASTGLELATAYVSIMPSTRGFAPSLSKQLGGAGGAASGAGRTMGNRFAAGFSGAAVAIGKTIKRGLLAGGALAATAGVIGIKTAAQMETANIAFTTMLGSGEKAQKFLSKLADFAAKTPFDLPGLQTSAQSLISIGIDADKVIPIMTTLGNVTAGMGTGEEGIKRATVAIQQMNAAQKINAEDLNQLRDAGIPVYDLLSAATGKSKEQIADLIAKGKLGKKELDQLMKALENGTGLERFNGMMEKQADSLVGIWSTLKDTFSVGMAEAIKPIIPLLKDGMNATLSLLQEKILPGVQNGLQWMLDNGPVIWNTITTAVQSTTTWVRDHETQIKAFAGLMTALFLPAMVRGTVALIAQGGAWVATKVKAMAAAVAYVFTSFQVVASWVRMGAAAVVSGAQTAAIWLMYRVDSVKAIAAMAVAKAKIAGHWVAMGTAAVVSGVKTAAVWTGQIIKSAALGAASFAVSAAKVIGKWALMGIQSLLHAAKMAAAWILAMGPVGWVTAAVIALVALVIANWKKISSFTADLWGKAMGKLADFRRFMVDKLAPAVTWLYNKAIKPIWDAVGDKIGNVWRKYIKPIFDTFMAVVKGDIPGAFKSASKLIDNYWTGLKRIASKPVEFVINTVIRNGLLGAFNKIAEKLKLPAIPLPPEFKGFATGGWTGYGAKHQPAGVVHADEYVLRKESQQDLRRNAPGYLDRLNRFGSKALGMFADGGLVRPVNGRTTSGFGVARGGYTHAGQDFAVPIGTAVKAALSGIVQRAGWNAVGGRSGLGMLLGHAGGRNTYYGHLSSVVAKVGDYVRQGQTIAKSGNTGNSTGPHLHFETWVGGKPVNPAKYLGGLLPSGAEGGADGGGMFDALFAPFAGMKDRLMAKFRDKFPGGGGFLDLAGGIGKSLLTSIPALVKEKLTAFVDGAKQDLALGGNALQWRGMAKAALKHTGDYSFSNLNSLIARMRKESGFNPKAINNWDSNAKKGTPSKGMMQVIDPTFAAYRDRTLGNDIWDPFQNTVAAIRYTKARYGNLRAGWDRAGGYALGGLVTPTLFDGGGWLENTGHPQVIDHQRRKPDAVLTNEDYHMLRQAAENGTGGGDVHIGQVLIPVADLAELKDVTDFIDALRRKARQK